MDKYKKAYLIILIGSLISIVVATLLLEMGLPPEKVEWIAVGVVILAFAFSLNEIMKEERR